MHSQDKKKVESSDCLKELKMLNMVMKQVADGHGNIQVETRPGLNKIKLETRRTTNSPLDVDSKGKKL